MAFRCRGRGTTGGRQGSGREGYCPHLRRARRSRSREFGPRGGRRQRLLEQPHLLLVKLSSAAPPRKGDTADRIDLLLSQDTFWLQRGAYRAERRVTKSGDPCCSAGAAKVEFILGPTRRVDLAGPTTYRFSVALASHW